MDPYYSDDSITLHHGDCLDVLRSLPDASVDSVVTDPPYGLSFMGKEWDRPTPRLAVPVCEECGNDDPTEGYRVCSDCLPIVGDSARISDHGGRSMLGHVSKNWHEKGTHSRGYADNDNRAFQKWCEQWTSECFRVLKPGGHMLAFGGTRTWHRLTVAVEDAGFDIRDSIAWMYGSGFPKSLDVSKAIDKTSGAERPTYARAAFGGTFSDDNGTTYGTAIDGTPITPAAQQWQGWGTALKPAFEPVVVARKPLGVGTVAANVLQHGTGALNIDACRVGDGEGVVTFDRAPRREDGNTYDLGTVTGVKPSGQGRWPANVVLDESQAEALDEQSGELTSGSRKPGTYAGLGYMGSESADFPGIDGSAGGASRFFYVAKADQSERPRVNGTAHPTVKPLDLMRWLVRLVTPPGGTVLEPFAGSGTTVEACIVEGFRCVAIEREADYLPLIESRIARRRNPVRAIELAGEDLGLFGEVSA